MVVSLRRHCCASIDLTFSVVLLVFLLGLGPLALSRAFGEQAGARTTTATTRMARRHRPRPRLHPHHQPRLQHRRRSRSRKYSNTKSQRRKGAERSPLRLCAFATLR